MKTFILLFCLFLLTTVKLTAQVFPPGQPQQNPCTPMLLCGGGTTTQASFQGVGDSSWLPHLAPGCLVNGLQSFTDVFFWEVNIASTGLFTFTLTPTKSCMDYDWIVYKLNPNLPCPQILDSATIVRCNSNDIYSSGPLGQTGLSPLLTSPPTPTSVGPGAAPPFLAAIPVTAGDVYLVAINNAGTYGCPVGTIPSPVNINFDSSTALFQDSVHPKMQSLIPSCNMAEQVQIHMNKSILCDSIAPDGSDFSINGGVPIISASGVNCGPGGLTNDVIINFASALPAGTYTIKAKVGSDGNTLLDECDTALLLPDSLQMTIAPYVPLGFSGVFTPACSEIRLGMNNRINCDSIAADGSDFAITGPQTVAVAGAYGVGCDTNGFTDSVVILLQQPLHSDGTYHVTAQKGSDHNTQVDSCGEHQAVGNAVTFNVNTYDHELIAAPHDTVLCKAGYMTLRTTTSLPPPPAPVICGSGNSCTNAGSHVAYGHDTLMAIHTPFSNYGKSRQQYLYRASDLLLSGMKPGTIQAIGWNIIQQNTYAPFVNFTIKIGCTNATVMHEGFITGLQPVYTANSYTAVPGWNVFPLTTPYNWDGTSNIVVEVCQDNTSYYGAGDEVEHAITPYPSVYHLYSNSNGTAGCGLYAGAATDAGYQSLRPKTRFDVCPAPTISPADRKYTWYPTSFLSDSSTADPLAYVRSSTTYSVATVDFYGCVHKDSAHVTVDVRSPKLEPHDDTAFCLGKEIQYNASGGTTYKWYSNDMAALSCANCADPLVTPTYTSGYHVVIGDKYNCTDTLGDSVTVYPLPDVQAFPHDTLVNYNATIQLNAAGAVNYIWLPALPLSTSNYIPDPEALITGPTVFSVYGIDSNGCHNTDSVHVSVTYHMPVLVPSAFTPNNDGKNDRFRVAGITAQRVIEFRIFNRWGQQIYTAEDNNGWDGTFNGVPQDVGEYNYLIRLTLPDGSVQTYKGTVTLIR